MPIIPDEDWTRGDPAAPPHVKDMWGRPDWDSFQEDASEEKPYGWNWLTGTWQTAEQITEGV